MFISGKGQVFLIFAVIVIGAFVALRTVINTDQLINMKKLLDKNYEKAFYVQIKNELVKAVEISALQTNVTDGLKNFVNFIQDRTRGKNLELKLFSAQARWENVTANENTTMNVTVLNLLGETISGLNLTFTYDNSEVLLSPLADNSTYSTQFIFNTSQAVSYSLLISYSTPTSKSYNITIPVRLGEGKVVSLFDLTLEASEATYKDEFIENYRLV